MRKTKYDRQRRLIDRQIKNTHNEGRVRRVDAHTHTNALIYR